MTPNPIIIARQLCKTYGAGRRQVTAVQDISFDVFPGELFGLFGPNGAGKSTIVKLLTTLLEPGSGTAVVNGFEVVKQALQVRASIGLVTADERSFYGRLSAYDNLAFYAAMQNVPRHHIQERVQYVLHLFGLETKTAVQTQTLSTGQKQRLNMARALVHDPPILFLDEPTKSMDVQTSDFVKELIKTELVGKQQKTIVFISHELYEMDHFCDRVVILANGRIQIIGTPAELAARLPRRALFRVVVKGPVATLAQTWQNTPGVEAVEQVSEGLGTAVFDIALADETVWLTVLETIQQTGGQLETYQRVDDESLRRIVAHFSTHS